MFRALNARMSSVNESFELVPGQGWGLGPGWDTGKRVRHRSGHGRRSHGCIVLCGPEPWSGGAGPELTQLPAPGHQYAR